MILWENARIAPISDPVPGQQIINDGALLTDGDRIVAVGERNSVLSNLVPAKADQSIQESVDCGGGLLLPGLIDCHTHLVFAGDRAREFEQRLEGLSYEEISRQGGGIRSTVAATRQSSEETLRLAAYERAARMCANGVITMEIKSGYGLNLDDEQKMLLVAQSLPELLPVSVHSTFLGAHAIPEEFLGSSNDYVDLVCEEMLPSVAAQKIGIICSTFSDVF